MYKNIELRCLWLLFYFYKYSHQFADVYFSLASTLKTGMSSPENNSNP